MRNGEALVKAFLPVPLFKRGKVRDIYSAGENLLIVSTDRLSAFDVVLTDGIPLKGEALNRLSVHWFRETEDIIPNHLVDTVDQRTVLVVKAEPIKVEFIVRGYLFGSAWGNYVRGEPISGVRLPPGMRKAERLEEPVLTPTTKEESGHDLETDMRGVAEIVGRGLLDEIEDVCLKIYGRASTEAEKKGVIIADTKLEFGLIEGNLILIDELLTPDSSRFWSKEIYNPGEDPLSFDKQYVRDYLVSVGWNKEPPPPRLPPNVVLETSKRYVEAYERLTGRRF